MTFVCKNPIPVELEEKMERFTVLGEMMKVAHSVAEYCRTQRHLIKQELKKLSADLNAPPLACQ
jgi:hypothetical protein